MRKRIEKLYEECIKEQVHAGIPFADNIAKIEVNSRAKSRFGACRNIKKGTDDCFVIELSEELFKCSDNEIKEVLHHEIIHTCKGCMNHGEKWKRYALLLNSLYGYNIKRTTSYEKLGIEKPVSKEAVKYIVKCEKCGTEFKRKRKCRLVSNVKEYRCGKCGGRLYLKS